MKLNAFKYSNSNTNNKNNKTNLINHSKNESHSSVLSNGNSTIKTKKISITNNHQFNNGEEGKNKKLSIDTEEIKTNIISNSKSSKNNKIKYYISHNKDTITKNINYNTTSINNINTLNLQPPLSRKSQSVYSVSNLSSTNFDKEKMHVNKIREISFAISGTKKENEENIGNISHIKRISTIKDIKDFIEEKDEVEKFFYTQIRKK